MSAQGYWCLGGPLHGKVRACAGEILVVSELAGVPPVPTAVPKSGAERVAYNVHRYRLTDHPRLGKVWQHVEPKEPT